MAWKGNDFKDAVPISQHLVLGNIYTSFHIRKYEIKAHMTSQAYLLRSFDRNEIVMLGSWVEICTMLVDGRGQVIDKHEIKVGDKVAGGHETLPSRMNEGQIFECSLSLGRVLSNRCYRVAPFDSRYEQEASRKPVFSELYEASKQRKNPWRKGKRGAQRVGEMEVWASERFDVAHIL
ncbi:unnamed protein product [Spirodela intermedia]|uniref:DNA-directed RNA polymerase n=1 Tax=Spirodela intermedia TaxID=51605 RepID=A0A7I8J2N3_SPIIN|nr:unnamed protein product [Spirodela intermedia]CAA6664475.1 unnamed protein product [Spirodela intermedia]